jgi:acetylornithine/succinyldiaminopimelate/putrescine aminotransferase
MASGLPVGAFTSSGEIMQSLQHSPKLGHITTFGGNPVIAAACLATLNELLDTELIQKSLEKEKLLRSLLVHPTIKEVRGKGLMLALIMENAEKANQIVLQAKENKLILFWLLFEPKAVRISPPLTISMEDIRKGCGIILDILNSLK